MVFESEHGNIVSYMASNDLKKRSRIRIVHTMAMS